MAYNINPPKIRSGPFNYLKMWSITVLKLNLVYYHSNIIHDFYLRCIILLKPSDIINDVANAYV